MWGMCTPRLTDGAMKCESCHVPGSSIDARRGTSDKAMRSDAHYHSLRAVERQETVREQYPGRGDVEEISFCYFPDALPEKLSTAKMWELLGQIREVNKG